MLKITSLIFASAMILNAANDYTLVFTSTKNIQNAKYFINKNFKNNERDVFIVKHNNRYRVTYGSFDNKNELNKFKKNLPSKLKMLDKFPAKNNQKNIVEVIKGKHQIKMVSKKETVKMPDKKINTYTYKHIGQLNPATKTIVVNEAIENKVVEAKNDMTLVKKQIKKPSSIKVLKKDESQAKKLIKKHAPKKKPVEESYVDVVAQLEFSALDIDNKFTHGTNGTNINLKLDKQVVIPKLTLAYKNHSVYVSYLSFNQEDSMKLNSTTIFNNTTYNSGDFVMMRYKTDWFKSGYRYSYNNLSFGMDFHDYSNEFSINTSRITKDFFFPALAFSNEHSFDKFRVLYGASWGKKSDKLKYHDYYFALGMDDLLLDQSNVAVGYKAKELDIEHNHYDGDTKYNGAYLNFRKKF